ncbi:class I SAM-dependent methyltransferase [Candidatus Protochlamydia phocaeensis]|uniref:class I SAM-dependent methyltransferase n=1 Tax=Candidatus Protochlamydia phocaeensis TaxID=1414722 RepID=UPI00083972A7|nr:class I SAM-dependent methyltransferase [Candidatus Protochlamydia phocaeensis]
MDSSFPEPYRSIRDLPFDDHGWFYNHIPLQLCLAVKPARTVIEVGSWLGSSTRFIASLLPEEGKVYAIDTWRGSPNEPIHMQDPRLPHLYQLFLSNVKQAGLAHKIVPIRMESLEAAEALNVQADLIYLDAAHDTPSVYEDIMAWHPHLADHGILCGDDFDWESVRIAVIKTAAILKKRIAYYRRFWWFEDQT